MTHPVDRKTEILDAALACFLAKGYGATSIADIRNASGATTGSIYHFFANKGALALSLIERAVAGWSEASDVAGAEDAETAIRRSVNGFVTWGLAHRSEFRFLDELRTLSLADPDFSEVAAVFARGTDAARARYAAFVERGEVRDLAWPLAHALMMGPAYDYIRLAPEHPDPDAALILAEAAWRAVSRP